jgi:hypothetical protein
MNALLLLLTLTTSTLVLRSGDRIAVEGTLREAAGVYTFRSGGLLYSLPASEVVRVEESRPSVEEKPTRKLRLSEDERRRLLEELEKNHAGTPPAPPQEFVPEAPAPSFEPVGGGAGWRAPPRSHEESLRRAQEELALLETRVAELQDQIHSFLSLGYQPRQFTYQTSQLARTMERIPYAKLEVTRAERAWLQFKEDARRAGVMPGRLR